MPEIEAKFLIRRSEQVADVIAAIEDLGFRLTDGGCKVHIDAYFDTADWALFRTGWVYRCREQEDALTLMLKSTALSRDHVFVRDEIKQIVPAGTKPTSRKLPAGPVRERLAEITGNDRLRELFTVNTRRRVFEARKKDDAGIWLEIDRDETRITAKRPARGAPGDMAFIELELELKEGDPAIIDELARGLARLDSLTPARFSKFDRGLLLAGLRITAKKRRKRPVLRGKHLFLDLLYGYLGRRLASLRKHEPVAWEGLDPEGVHKMRVAIRRIRAMLAAFPDLFAKDMRKPLDRELRWLARQLGNARDADVCETSIARFTAILPPDAAVAIRPYADFLRESTVDAYMDLHKVLDGERYRSLVNTLDQLVASGPDSRTKKRFGDLSIAEASRRYVKPAIRKFLHRGDRISVESPARDVHKLRIRAKRLRYLLDLFSEAQPRRWRDATAALEKLQDLLGEHQDACTAADRLGIFIDSLGRRGGRALWLALGRLQQIEDERIARCRRGFPSAWDRFRKAVKR